MEAWARHVLGVAAACSGEVDDARAHLDESLRIESILKDVRPNLLGIEGAAILAAAEGRWRDCVVLASAAGARRDDASLPRMPLESLLLADPFDRAARALGPAATELAIQHGNGLTLEEAVARARTG